MEVKRLFDLVPYALEKYDKPDALAGKRAGKWIKYSNKQYAEIADYVSSGLLLLGIKKGDNIASIINNRPEWNFIDAGILQIGAVHVSIYPTINEEELGYILKQTGSKIIFVSSKFLYRKVSGLLPQLPDLKRVYAFDTFRDADNFTELTDSGKNNLNKEELDGIKENISSDDLATIIYTSGTSGVPKGAMHAHKSIIANFKTLAEQINLNPEYKAISYLPVSSLYERMHNYLHQYQGVSIYNAESVAGIIDNFREIQPHVVTAVPLLLEKIFESLLSYGAALKGLKKKFFKYSLHLALKYKWKNNSVWYLFRLAIADQLIFKNWRKGLGGNIKIINIAGAVAPVNILKTFWAAKMPVIEKYGLTEMPTLASYTSKDVKFGTVGKIFPIANVKISDEGEILAKGPNLMLGYYNDDERTAEAIDSNGWFHTGDRGEIDEEGYLRITGRIHDIFKIASGVYISPEVIENKLKKSEFIKQVLVFGSGQRALSAIIVPDFDFLENYCHQQQMKFTGPESMIKNLEVRNIYDKLLKDYNSTQWEAERIHHYELIIEEWTLDKGELTPTLKLKRNVILNKYKDLY